MWGGVKVRKNYGDVFKNWSGTKGLDELRRAVYQEPRPWFVGFRLHEHRHLLQDTHCARLISWAASVVQLQANTELKREAYGYTQELFGVLVHTHKAGAHTLAEYLRLCEVGKDLSMAFRWHKFWLETKRDGAASLGPYVWLLRVAAASPSDESAEDMAAAVRESYLDHFATDVVYESTDTYDVSGGQERVTSFQHFRPATDEEREQFFSFCCAFRLLKRKLTDSELLQFAAALPVTDADVRTYAERGYPGPNHCHTFPHLEAGVPVPRRDVAHPALVDSVLHPDLLRQLEHAAFEQKDAKAVIALLQQYKDAVVEEGARAQKGAGNRPHRPIWRQPSDATARAFRHDLVTAGGLTPELYHYLVVALGRTQPTAALRTMERMKESNLRVLDWTRTVALVSAEGSLADQQRLFKEQLDDIDFRRQLDEQHETNKMLEHYWKYQYTDFFYYRNALDEEAFYTVLMHSLGAEKVQQLLLNSGRCGPETLEEELVVVSAPLRKAALSYFRGSAKGTLRTDHAISTIASAMPLLDLSAIGEDVPHFREYCLRDEADEIMTDLKAIKDHLKSFDVVYLMDASFVETGEAFLKVGKEKSEVEGKRVLVLFPFTLLQQLSRSAKSEGSTPDAILSFDPALQETIQQESILATQRLQSIFAMTQEAGAATRAPAAGTLQRRVLHFTECLLSHHFAPEEKTQEGGKEQSPLASLDPAVSDNDQMVLLLTMLYALAEETTEVVLCCDDVALIQQVNACKEAIMQHRPHGKRRVLQILQTDVPEQVEEANPNLIDDNPIFDFDEQFTPRLQSAIIVEDHVNGSALPPTETAVEPSRAPVGGEEPIVHSPWLDLLAAEEEAEEVADAATAAVVAVPLTEELPAGVAEETEKEEPAEPAVDLMQLYESPHDVVPVGVRMEEASQMGSVFEQFDVMDPEEEAIHRANMAAEHSALSSSSDADKKKRRRSRLEKDFLQNRGASNKERFRLAKQLSNRVGGRVPFNFRYRVVKANVNDPKNAHLKAKYKDALQKKRDSYRRNRINR